MGENGPALFRHDPPQGLQKKRWQQHYLLFVILILTGPAASIPPRDVASAQAPLRKIVAGDLKPRNASAARATACVQTRPPAVETSQILQAWGKILKGEYPSLSIEI